MGTPIKKALRLEDSVEVEVGNDGTLLLQAVRYDNGEEILDVLAEAGEVVPVLEALLAFAQANTPAKAEA